MARHSDGVTWLSASKWKSVTRCGEAVRLERVEKVPSRPAAWTVRGNATHDTIETWEVSGRSIDPEKYYKEEAWPKALQESLDKYPDTKRWFLTPRVKSYARDIELRHDDGLKQVVRYVERALDEEDLWRVIAAEVPFELEFPGILVRGKIDQVRQWHDGDLSLWDVKTGGADGEDNRQLGVYRWGYLEATGSDTNLPVEDIVWGSYWYTKLDRGSDPIDLSIYTYDYLNQEFQKVKKIVDEGLYLANPSIDNCKFCGVAEYCKESKQ